MPGPRRHRGLESGALRQREFAGAGGDPVAIGIGEMNRRTLQRLSIRARLTAISWEAISSVCFARLQWVIECAPKPARGSSANDFNSSQDMQSSRQIAVSSTP